MKKLTALILALCTILCMFTLAACGEEEPSSNNGGDTSVSENGGNNTSGSVYDTVAAAIEKTLKAKSFEANVEDVLKTNLMGNESEVSVKANIKAAELDTDKPKVNYDSNSEYVMDCYYNGEWKYFGAEGQGTYKSQTSFADFAAEIGMPQAIIVELPEALFKDAKSDKSGDSLTVTLTVDEATMETLYKETVTDVVYDVVGEDLTQATTKNATIVVTVKEGYVTEYKLSFVSEIVAGSDKVTYDSYNSVSFVSCDKDINVPAPANLDQYYVIDQY